MVYCHLGLGYRSPSEKAISRFEPWVMPMDKGQNHYYIIIFIIIIFIVIIFIIHARGLA